MALTNEGLPIDLWWQSDVSGFLICCLDLSQLFKEQASFNSVAAVTVCSDFGAQENEI